MAQYRVYQNQWLFLTLLGGTVLLIAVLLCYWSMWRPRREERESERQEITGIGPFFSWLIGIAPWAVILAALGTLTYTLVHTGMAALRTPNW